MVQGRGKLDEVEARRRIIQKTVHVYSYAELQAFAAARGEKVAPPARCAAAAVRAVDPEAPKVGHRHSKDSEVRKAKAATASRARYEYALPTVDDDDDASE